MTTSIRGIAFGQDRRQRQSDPDFKHSLAIVIGIDDYANGTPPLRTAVNDATRLAQLLEADHGYETRLLTEDVTRKRMLRLLRADERVKHADRVLFYFAGHGIALDSDKDNEAAGLRGYLVPQDANPAERDAFVAMEELVAVFRSYRCRHLLVILDCCFAGSFRWAGGTRSMPRPPEKIHRERYRRYVRFDAWQAITSAAHDQKALDVLAGVALGGEVLGHHGEEADGETLHSPFARHLFAALAGAADQYPKGTGDGLITATELFLLPCV